VTMKIHEDAVDVACNFVEHDPKACFSRNGD